MTHRVGTSMGWFLAWNDANKPMKVVWQKSGPIEHGTWGMSRMQLLWQVVWVEASNAITR